MADESRTDETEPSADRRSAHFGIVCTQAAEVRYLVDRLDRARKYADHGAVFRGGFLEESIRVAIVEAGPGFAQHRQVTQTLIAEHHPAWVLSVGFSSPLTDEAQSGDLCLASEICDTHGNSLPVKCRVSESKRILVRKHVTADRHPASTDERRDLASSTGAAAVDSTSLAVAQMCQPQDDDVPRPQFLSVRGIVGGCGDDLSPKVISHLFEPDTSDRAGLLDRWKQRFRKDPELVPWDPRADETARNLNRFVLATISRLFEKL